MSWWFKKHPRLLEVECDRLSSNSNYKEHFRSRENILVSSGEIIVRLYKTTKHPVVIIYPESTPYNLPIIILVNQIINEEEVLSLSKNSSSRAILSLKDKVKFYNYWHQNADGSICLLETDNLEKYGEFFTIHDLINRTREWLAGLKTGKLPPDNPEVELFAHFRNIDDSKEILIPEVFFSDDFYQGEFYGTIVSHVYPTHEIIEKRIYTGILLQGENKKGIRINSIEYNENIKFLPKGINTPIDIINEKQIIENATLSKELIEGFWWNINKIIRPIQDMPDFAKLIGDEDINHGYTRIRNIIGDVIKKLPNEIILAIRFTNKRNEKEWQTFSLTKKDKVSSPYILCSDDIQDFISLFDNYILQAIRCNEITEYRHHLRNKGLAHRKLLREKMVNIIGCGALGGEVADIISKAGIGVMTLVDFETLKFDNTVRHVLGYNQLGLAKVHALEQHILFHNPFVKTIPIAFNIMNHGINQYFIPGIGISTIANDNVEGYLNEQAIINNKTIFYARALNGGKTGRIFRVIPGKDACFHCLSLYSSEENELFTVVPEDTSLPTITNECNNPIRPASAAELKLIASITSKLLIDHLQKGVKEENHWIWSTEEIAGIPFDKVAPYTLRSSIIPPHPKCQYCQPTEEIIVNLKNDVLEEMIDETKKNHSIETGGILLGEILKGRTIIHFASAPGPKAIKTGSRFEKDIEYCQKYIDEKYVQHGNNASYIGEWHYHPSIDNKPSGTDLNSLSEIANHRGYLTDNPVMIILSNEGKASCTIHPASKSYYFTTI
jgi:integrative and conjugative element protein (TIGR02256 family)